jgi:hypothetical protein
MTNTDIPNQPHVICFVRNDGRLRAVAAAGDPGEVSDQFAIFPNRRLANEAIAARYHNAPGGTLLFSVPAASLFTEETQVVFNLIRR